jgi:hypothetical protein
MTFDADVVIVARKFGLDPSLLQAVVTAEGDILKAVRCSLPDTKDRAAALDITARSCVHAMCDWVKNGGEERQDSFIAFWANRWAPTGAANDPHHLNENWASNVDRLWTPLVKDEGKNA